MDAYNPNLDYEVLTGDCLQILPTFAAGSVDAVIVDPPYSERTHKGHDACLTNHRGNWDGVDRKPLGYTPWSEQDARRFVQAAHTACKGWIVVMCDHVLAPIYMDEMERCERYVFAPIPWYVSGSRVRLNGDGPSSWTTWIVVGRTAAQLRWGTLPGGYTESGKHSHMGGKPVELMSALVRDYSRPGDLVCDPACGSGTTLVACRKMGRRSIGIEISETYAAIARRRIAEAGFPLFGT